MTQFKIIIKPRKGKHLSFEERVLIHHLHTKLKYSNREIARQLGRAPQTIHNEIKRGSTTQIKRQHQYGKTYTYEGNSYFPDIAQRKYTQLRKNCGRRLKWLVSDAFIQFADNKMLGKEKWSPDIVIGYAKKMELFPKESIPCTTTLYNWIDKGYSKTINLDLLLQTKRNTKQKRVRKNLRILGDSIENRSESINKREEMGHWEIDTIIGIKSANEPVLLTLTERKTRFNFIVKIESKSPKSVNQAVQYLKTASGELFPKLFKTITADNGIEFSNLDRFSQDEMKIYFTHPYSSWERGTNEKHNGMIRRFIPKGIPISKISATQIVRIQQHLNDLPRKILGYQTPHEVFAEELKKMRLHTPSIPV